MDLKIAHGMAPGAAAEGMPDAELIRRYDRNGPRYTSYPTALQFDSRFGPLDHAAAAARAVAAAPDAPLSVYVHVPFCASPCFYCACTKIITRQLAMADSYLLRLEREIELQSRAFGKRRPIAQLHFGGGTPTFLSIDHLSCLFGSLDRYFGLAPPAQREYSIEIDPRTVQPAALAELAALGFNRVSLGIQDFDPQVQKAVNREQSVEHVTAIVAAARRAGFGSVAMDLIYGLPQQTPASFAQTLSRVIELQPNRIAAYSYAHMPERFKPQRQIRTDQLPGAAAKLELLQLIVQRLLAAGYVHVGMDHFAHPDDELARALREGTMQRNFQGYSTHGGTDLLGLGMSAISRLADTYSQNARTLPGYYAAVDASTLPTERGIRLSADDAVRRDVIAALMCSGELHFADIERQHGIAFDRYFAAELVTLGSPEHDGLVQLREDGIRVTPQGRFLLRAIVMPFDAYIGTTHSTDQGHRPRYSRIV
jgi:oxygen-independent coproporphyrinogen-3 oxidase